MRFENLIDLMAHAGFVLGYHKIRQLGSRKLRTMLEEKLLRTKGMEVCAKDFLA